MGAAVAGIRAVHRPGSQGEPDPRFRSTLEAVRNVLPTAKLCSGVKLRGAHAPVGSDFEALDHLKWLTSAK